MSIKNKSSKLIWRLNCNFIALKYGSEKITKGEKARKGQENDNSDICERVRNKRNGRRKEDHSKALRLYRERS